MLIERRNHRLREVKNREKHLAISSDKFDETDSVHG